MSNKLSAIFAAALTIAAATSCDNNKSYAELLNEENQAVNYYLANNKVIAEIPEDSVFQYGENAPFYRIDEDGNLYMQVINPGTPDNKAELDELIYFRFTRYDLRIFQETGHMNGVGNANDLANGSTSFRFQNTTLSSASNYGMGIQEPLKFLGIDCEVNIVIKSQLGPSNEMASVVPYLYNVRYFKSPL